MFGFHIYLLVVEDIIRISVCMCVLWHASRFFFSISNFFSSIYFFFYFDYSTWYLSRFVCVCVCVSEADDMMMVILVVFFLHFICHHHHHHSFFFQWMNFVDRFFVVVVVVLHTVHVRMYVWWIYIYTYGMEKGTKGIL